MKLSTRGRYGLRVMLELALHEADRPVMMSRIAEAQEISRKYLHNLLTILKNAEYVRAVRGSAGGYILAIPPEKIRLGELVEALEGRWSLVDCIPNPQTCHRSATCVTREIWDEVSQAARAVLDSMTLADLVERHRKKNAAPLDFSI